MVRLLFPYCFSLFVCLCSCSPLSLFARQRLCRACVPGCVSCRGRGCLFSTFQHECGNRVNVECGVSPFGHQRWLPFRLPVLMLSVFLWVCFTCFVWTNNLYLQECAWACFCLFTDWLEGCKFTNVCICVPAHFLSCENIRSLEYSRDCLIIWQVFVFVSQDA